MLTIPIHSRIVTRYFRNEAGRFFRGYFLVTERAGKYFVKPIRVEEVSEAAFSEKVVVALPVLKKASKLSITKVLPPTVSPYFPSDFSFFNSQPIRAPNYSY